MLVFTRGELLVKNLTQFCIQNKIPTGVVQGIGAAQSATVGYYQLSGKRYKFKKFNKFLEITSLLGNVTLKDGQPWLHLHIVLSDAKLRTYGGHLKEATVGGTCEVYLRTFKKSLKRGANPETGLSTIQ